MTDDELRMAICHAKGKLLAVKDISLQAGDKPAEGVYPSILIDIADYVLSVLEEVDRYVEETQQGRRGGGIGLDAEPEAL